MYHDSPDKHSAICEDNQMTSKYSRSESTKIISSSVSNQSLFRPKKERKVIPIVEGKLPMS